MLSFQDAYKMMLEQLEPLPGELVPVSSASGRFLADSVSADRDFPPFNRSAMDGYAVRFEDLQQIPATLNVVGEVPAGVWPSMTVASGQAVRIMTGAPVPQGADSVQMVENTESEGDQVKILQGLPGVGAHICPQGEDVRAGEVVLKPGTQVRAAVAGVLAAVGCASVRVHRRPRVCVLSTGDELVDVIDQPRPQQIRDSNRYAMAALANQAGGEVIFSGRVSDDPDELEQAITEGLGADVLLLSGGVSAGVYDLVKQTLERLGAQILFHKVRIKPGKPLLVARTRRTLIFGLPGNPVSATVMMQLFVAPALLALQGVQRPEHTRFLLSCVAPLRKTGGRETFYPGQLERIDGQMVVRPVEINGSGDLIGFAQGNCLIRRDPGSPASAVGELVEVFCDRASFHA